MSLTKMKTPTTIILHGGLLRMSNPALNFVAVNIALTRSNAWLNGTLFLDKKAYYRLLPIKDNYIEIKNINCKFFLTVNEKVIYEHYNLFGYTIKINLNKAITDKPYADFFKYY